jgi:DNA-binding transcriptional LysR family regulator
VTDITDMARSLATALLIAREGSFRGAMRSANAGFRTLEKQIKSLERQLGFLMFHRTGDGVVPTPEGQQVLMEAQKIEQIIAQILRIGQSLNHETTGDVMLATTEGLGTFWITPQLTMFNRIHPGITVRVHPSMALVDMRRYDTDVALQVVEPVLPEIKRMRLGRLHMVLAAAPAYVARHGKPKTMADLAQHSFVFHTSPQSSDRQLIEDAVKSKLAQSQFNIMRNSAAHYVTVEQGLGIGFIPTYGFGIGAKLVHIDLPVRHSLDIWLCFHEASRSTPRVAAVIDWLSGIFDPRLYPWFRREFVPPKDFDRVIDVNGSRALVDAIRLNR